MRSPAGTRLGVRAQQSLWLSSDQRPTPWGLPSGTWLPGGLRAADTEKSLNAASVGGMGLGSSWCTAPHGSRSIQFSRVGGVNPLFIASPVGMMWKNLCLFKRSCCEAMRKVN